MSRNGASLADWQDIYNGVNERRKAVMYYSGVNSDTPGSTWSIDLFPVVQSRNHITRWNLQGLGGGLLDKLPVQDFCDPSNPLTFQTWDTSDDVGSVPNGTNHLDLNVYDCRDFWRYVSQLPSFYGRDIPGYTGSGGGYLAGSGWLLDHIDDALGYMTKAASAFSNQVKTRYRSQLQWYEYGTYDIPPGSVWDGVTGDWISGLTISSYADLWTYAVQNLHLDTTYWDTISAVIGTSSNTVEIKFSSWEVPHPGVIPADLTLYYSATGDNLGYTPTNYQQSGGPYVHGYATRTQQAASAASPLTIGFTSAVIPSATPAPGYYAYEELSNFFAVWDFAPYFRFF